MGTFQASLRERMSKDVSERLSEDMSEDMSERVSEDCFQLYVYGHLTQSG